VRQYPQGDWQTSKRAFQATPICSHTLTSLHPLLKRVTTALYCTFAAYTEPPALLRALVRPAAAAATAEDALTTPPAQAPSSSYVSDAAVVIKGRVTLDGRAEAPPLQGSALYITARLRLTAPVTVSLPPAAPATDGASAAEPQAEQAVAAAAALVQLPKGASPVVAAARLAESRVPGDYVLAVGDLTPEGRALLLSQVGTAAYGSTNMQA
jgi:hypothetical protein